MRARALALALLLATGASAAEPLRLTRPVSDSAFPRIAAPLTPTTSKINAALAQLDRRWAGFVKECMAGGKDHEAERGVQVTMAGPRFLSLIATDSESCGGVHPDASTLALVYDLDAGRPVDWRVLLGPRLVADTSVDTVIDGTRIGMIGSKALSGLYVRTDRPDKQCAAVLLHPGPKFVAWLDGRRHGLTIEPVLPHVAAACANDVTIPLADLRRLGANPALISALAGR